MVVDGLIGDSGVVWQLRTTSIPVPIEFVADFISASLKTYPFLYPVRSAKSHRILSQYKYSEKLAQAVTDLLVLSGWADRAVGNQAAKCRMSLQEMANRLDVEL